MVERDHLTRAESETVLRRRKGRNWAILIVLVGLVVLFYFMTLARMGGS